LWPLAIASLMAWSSPAPAAPAGDTPAAEKPAAKKPADKKAAKKKDPKAKGEQPAKPATKPADAKAAVPLPSARPNAASKGSNTGHVPSAPPASRPGAAAPARAALAVAPSIATPTTEIAAVKRAVELVRGRKQSDANEIGKNLSDPLAKKLVEWVILRSDDAGADFSRYAAFIAANPSWPSTVTLRRKAEALMFQERTEPAAVRAFFANYKPLSAKGRLALARALLLQGDRKSAETLVREVWRNDPFSEDVEAIVQQGFGDVLTRADHKARMDRRLYTADDTGAGVRAANRLAGNEPAIAKARIAMLGKGGDKKLVEAVPAAARNDVGYKFARIQMLRREDKINEAAELMASVPNQLNGGHNLDEWWVERRLLARKLLDIGEPKKAYLVARDATPPDRDVYRAEHQFTAGWIALRFLNDPATAYAHFSRVAEGNDNPIALSRAAYWQGRAAEALKKTNEARAHYQEAAKYPTAYYGQIARAKAGLGELTLAAPAIPADQRTKLAQLEVVRAAELLYAVDARDLVNTMLADLGDKLEDTGALLMLAEVASRHQDARGMLLVGKLALARGYPLEQAAFPTVGVPNYEPVGPAVEPAIVYSIVRQESWFNPRTVSSANALGLMQVTPPAGRYVAKKFNVTFDQKRLLTDMSYNVQMGAAELGDVIKDYRGSYILAFAAYNAGRGRVKEWVGRYGDPRDPKVDPIDWVERIPFAETRNYVQRVMENVQVYRVRFGGGSNLLIEADLRRGSSAN
jgi:soluble lytic murein transglycosylase